MIQLELICVCVCAQVHAGIHRRLQQNIPNVNRSYFQMVGLEANFIFVKRVYFQNMRLVKLDLIYALVKVLRVVKNEAK